MSKLPQKRIAVDVVAAPTEAPKPTHEFIGIKRHGSNDIGLYVLKDGKAVEVARDTFAIIQGKMCNELYRICYMSEGK
jgi:hypothetical protein